jgi:hypothetical protein
MMKSTSIDIMNGLFPEYKTKGCYEFRMNATNVIQQLIFRTAQSVNERFASDLIAYLAMIERHKLDGYHKVSLYLSEYNAEIHILTSASQGSLVMTITDLQQGPPKHMRKAASWFSRLLGI